MKEIKNVTLYGCDFCKKKSRAKWAMEYHELRCASNPLNNRPCLSCKNLCRVDAEYDTGLTKNEDGDTVWHSFQAFKCSKLDKIMSHPKVQFFRNKDLLSYVYLGDLEVEQTPMPTECSDFEGFEDSPLDIFNQ